MKYFSGFSLQDEASLFEAFIPQGAYSIAGFSYGAIEAFEYALKSERRIERLTLLSPAFFQYQKPSFQRTQLRYFEANKEAYIKQFLTNVSYPSSMDISEYLKMGTKEELERLLSYLWDKEKIQTLLDRGTVIEVFLGEEDKIIDMAKASDFFEPLGTLYKIKDVGHLLR